MELIDNIGIILKNAITQYPFEVSLFFVAVIEEIIAPIPAPFLFFYAGSIVHEQNGPLLYLLWIAAFGAAGKTLGTWLYYYLANKTESVVVTKYGKFLGVTHKQVTELKNMFTGTSWKDAVLLFALRAIPIVPTLHVSIFCGIVEFKLRQFLIITYFGFLIRVFFFLYIGYQGKATYDSFTKGYGNIEGIVGTLMMVLLIGFLYMYFSKKRKKL